MARWRRAWGEIAWLASEGVDCEAVMRVAKMDAAFCGVPAAGRGTLTRCGLCREGANGCQLRAVWSASSSIDKGWAHTLLRSPSI